MRRAAVERSRTLRVWRQHLALDDDDSNRSLREFQPGRFRKGERIGGCGSTRCWMCSADKLLGAPTVQERRAIASQRDGIAELQPAVTASE